MRPCELGLAAFLLPVAAVALRFDAPAVVAFAAGVIGLLPIAGSSDARPTRPASIRARSAAF